MTLLSSKGVGPALTMCPATARSQHTSVICYTMEHTLSKQISKYLESHNLLSPHQYGFRLGRGCDPALAFAVHTLTKHLDSRSPFELVQLDFRQAFVKVNHALLVEELGSFHSRKGKMTFRECFLCTLQLLQTAGMFKRYGMNAYENKYHVPLLHHQYKIAHYHNREPYAQD